MPYEIINNATGCNGYAVVKVGENEPVAGGCHLVEADAIKHAAAMNIATSDEMRSRSEAVLIDIDDTILRAGQPIQNRIDYINKLDNYKIVVTGRQEQQRVPTVKALRDAGLQYDELLMNPGGDPVAHKRETAKKILDRMPIVKAYENNEDARQAYDELGIEAIDPADLDGEQNRAVDLTPPEYVRDNCRRGIDYYENGFAGDGLRPRTVTEARQIAAGKSISEDKIVRMRAWIARHLVDLDNAPEPSDDNYPSPGQVAHLLWGSGTTRAAAQKTYDWTNIKVKQIEADRNVAMDNETRELPPSYRPADSADVPVVRPSCSSCEHFEEDQSYCEKWMMAVEANYYCDAYCVEEDMGGESPEEEPTTEDTPMTIMTDESNNLWITRSLDERRSVAYTTIECRAIGDGNTLVGYAALFDTPSHDLGGFVEYVSPGAFRKTLNDGADVRLLIDHEGAPLARTKSGTMRLIEDERGLRVEAELDPSNPTAAGVISALRRGDMNQMSFAFRTVKDEWSRDRATRTLKEVRLFDVSVVTFPAYEATVAEVRGLLDNTPTESGNINRRKRQIQIIALS